MHAHALHLKLSKQRDQSADVDVSQCNDTSLLGPESHLSWLEDCVWRMFMLSTVWEVE